ncbi:hypothetical protein [Streptomyces sp. V4I23]|nr:hypothetical protein [Streptomyces sp. V4I23]
MKDAGVDYLAETPEMGCITARKIAEQTPDGADIDRACTIGCFLWNIS